MGIPLPALGLRPVEQPDPLGQLGKVVALKSLMQNQAAQQQMLPLQVQQAQQQSQLGQLQLQDQLLWRKTSTDPDRKSVV